MNFLLVITLKSAIACYAVIPQWDESLTAFDAVYTQYQAAIENVTVYETGLLEGTVVLGDTPIMLNGITFSCTK